MREGKVEGRAPVRDLSFKSNGHPKRRRRGRTRKNRPSTVGGLSAGVRHTCDPRTGSLQSDWGVTDSSNLQIFNPGPIRPVREL